MTTPEERRRNLIWGRETLAELAEDVRLAPSWRDQAASLLHGYPSMAACKLEDLIQLREAHAEVLIGAKIFFQRLMAQPSCAPETSYTLLVVLRHFD